MFVSNRHGAILPGLLWWVFFVYFINIKALVEYASRQCPIHTGRAYPDLCSMKRLGVFYSQLSGML